MKTGGRWLKAVLAASAMALFFTGCGAVFKDAPKEEELLACIPKIDTSAYNQFTFTMDVTAGNAAGDTGEFSMTGTVELQGGISHMHDLDITLVDSGRKINAETWVSFGAGKRYINIGEGFMEGEPPARNAINDLADAINARDTEMLLTADDSACTLSWTFPTDNRHLFGGMLGHFTDDLELEGDGRITAVFDPKTYEFEYFTFVISASNQKQDGALLDAVFHWDVKNDPAGSLRIPEEISAAAYETATGVSITGEYDETVNPLAEDLIKSYGGTAKTVKETDSAYMFWTLEDKDTSAAINYRKMADPASFFAESRSFLASLYGPAAEETENDACFYDAPSGQLIYIAKGDAWYAEVIITGKPDTPQGDLRKPFITYKAKLGI